MLHFLGRTPEKRRKKNTIPGDGKKWLENLTMVVSKELLVPSVFTDRGVT